MSGDDGDMEKYKWCCDEIIPSSISGLCARINPLLKYIMENGVKTLKLDFNESILYLSYGCKCK